MSERTNDGPAGHAGRQEEHAGRQEDGTKATNGHTEAGTHGDAESSESGSHGASDAHAGGGAEDGASEPRGGSGQGTREMPFADNIHGLVDDILEGVRNFTPVAGVRYPRYDFIETPGAYLLAFDLPGVERAGVSVSTEGEDLVVTGERPTPEWGDEAVLRRSERAFGRFRRTLRMPADVDLAGIRAKLDDGILTVTLPRHAAGSGRKVDIEG